MRTTILFGGVMMGAAAIAACQAPSEEEATAESEAELLGLPGWTECLWKPQRYKSWCFEQKKRQQAADRYVADHRNEADEFTTGAFANEGLPLVFFKLLPEVFPEIWGEPEDAMAPLGAGPNPYDRKSPVPLGFATMPSGTPLPPPLSGVRLTMVTLACSYCHVGRVDVDGKTMHLLGAPSTQNVNIYLPHIATAPSPKMTAKNLRAELVKKPLGWLFPRDPSKLVQEIVERTVFLMPGVAEKIVEEYKAGFVGGKELYESTFGKHTYSVPNAPGRFTARRGSLDTLTFPFFARVDPANPPGASELPQAPGETDMMSAWRQNDRPLSHWDGNSADKAARNTSAAIATVPKPLDFRTEVAHATTAFTSELPSPPYPFDVDMDSANRGKTLFGKYCISCHERGNDLLFSPSETGTDPNRAVGVTSYLVRQQTAAIRAGLCRTERDCRNPDGSPLEDEQIARITGSYVSVPLTGVWATAPYLHNGSVPTLRALLTGDRPTTFFRGNTAYDEEDVGFVYDRPTAGTTEYDTRLSGLSNRGHTGPEFLGDVDWKRETQKLNDLLEYLKTL